MFDDDITLVRGAPVEDPAGFVVWSAFMDFDDRRLGTNALVPDGVTPVVRAWRGRSGAYIRIEVPADA